MRPNPRLLPCNPQLIGGYLQQSLSARDEAALVAHLDDCPDCRQRLDDSAAEADLWKDASRYLKADAWDDEATDPTSASAFSSATNQSQHFDDLTMRQLQTWLDPTDDPQYVGRFGGYEILGVVGQGGMGVVLKGFERSLNRYVAIKVLSPSLATSGAARQRFAREAQAAAAVLHENVIAIHRVADARGLPYLVMPYVGGMSLQKRIEEEGPLPLLAILRISRQVAAGLAAAHAQGLVHRDIKPANILLERGVERVTITDFGLARAADDGSLTRTGCIAGTPQYMSPEQARGESLDARSDLFSLGSVMYAMAAGHAPFRAETSYGILRRITDGAPRPIREVNPDIPPWLQRLIGKLHARSLAERIGSAEEVAELLEQCLAHVQQPATAPLPESLRTPEKRRRPRSVAIAAGGAAIVLSLAWLVYAFLPPASVEAVRPGDDPLKTEVAASAPVPHGNRNLPNRSPHEAEWDAAARQIDDLDALAERLSAEVEQLWSPLPTSPISPLTPDQELAP